MAKRKVRNFRIRMEEIFGPFRPGSIEELASLHSPVYFQHIAPPYTTTNVDEATVVHSFNMALYWRNCSNFHVLLQNSTIEEFST